MTVDGLGARRRGVLALGAAALAAPWVRGASAQGAPYPDKPIRLVLGFPPGGATDVMGRLVAQRLGDVVGQQVVVENRAGAAGNIASEIVAKAKNDGYTLLFGTSIMSIVPALYATLPYDPIKDLDAIALTGIVPIILFTSADGPKTAAELIQKLRAEPGKYTYPSPGNGSLMHLTAHLFSQRAKVDAVHVPYRGSGPALQDTLAGRHLFQFETFGAVRGFVESGRLRILGIATEARSTVMPDVPTIKEAAGFELLSRTWNVVFAPAGTPRPVIETLNAAINKGLSHPELRAKAAGLAIDVVGDSTPQSADKFYRDQLAYWGPIARSSGVRIE